MKARYLFQFLKKVGLQNLGGRAIQSGNSMKVAEVNEVRLEYSF